MNNEEVKSYSNMCIKISTIAARTLPDNQPETGS